MEQQSKKETRKEKKARKREEFKTKHPKLYDFIVKASAVTVVVGPLALMYFLGYSDGSKISPKAMQENFEETEKEINDLHAEWLRKQRDAYLSNGWNEGKYANNAAEFLTFAENFQLQPGESYFIWDDNQFKGEDLPVDINIEHQVYGVVDPSYDDGAGAGSD